MIKNYLITGDTHSLVVSRLNEIDKEMYPPAETAVIILGDAGLNFYLNKTDEKNKEAVQKTGYTIYCVRGNHEERPELLPSMCELYDDNIAGPVYIEPNDYPNIRYLKDGGVYNINGFRTLVIGGAYSVDKWYRLNRAGVFSKLDYNYDNPKKTGWFPAEQLDSREMFKIENEHSGKSFDIVLSHTCPLSWQPTDLFLPFLDQSSVDSSMEQWMDEFKEKINWGAWLWGHYHTDRIIGNGAEIYYQSIENLNNIVERNNLKKGI